MTHVKAARGTAGYWVTMDSDLLARYGQNVPRYTSYPTAPHFGTAVGARDYARWLATLPENQTLSLYLHIPFCDSLCWFCGCHTKLVRDHAPIDRYLVTLLREAELVADALGAQKSVRHLHFGGGSPSLLRPRDIERVSAALARRFDIRPGVDFAVEIDPRDVDRDRIAAWAAAGMNRASIGVQDCDPAVQQAINRIQSFECTARAVDWLREAGIGSVNIDLMYGLPYQSIDSVRRTVAEILPLAPDRVALFGYAHVPWMKTHQRLIPEAALPDGAERLAQFLAAAAALQEAGYLWIGLDHFARPQDDLAQALLRRTLRRNFQGYTTDGASALVGLGSSAIGMLPPGYVQNAVPLRQYDAAVVAGVLPVARGHRFSPDDRLRRAVIEQLMCYGEVDLGRMAAEAGTADSFAAERGALGAMAADGLVELDGARLSITERGRPLTRTVCAVFDRYLAAATARHSRAV